MMVLTESSLTTSQLLSYEIRSQDEPNPFNISISIYANLISNYTISYFSPQLKILGGLFVCFRFINIICFIFCF
jgi:hypothetical protein